MSPGMPDAYSVILDALFIKSPYFWKQSWHKHFMKLNTVKAAIYNFFIFAHLTDQYTTVKTRTCSRLKQTHLCISFTFGVIEHHFNTYKIVFNAIL